MAVGTIRLGLKEQLVFPEIDYDKVDKVRGMDVVIVTTANTDEEARELLTRMECPSVQEKVDIQNKGGNPLAKKSMIAKAKRNPKYKVRAYTRCERCGRPHSVIRKFPSLSDMFP